MTNEKRESRFSPALYAAPVSSGPWWLGFNDAKSGRDYHNDYVLKVDRFQYEEGYDAGK